MQVTKNIIKLSNMLIRIPDDCKRVWDMSENRIPGVGICLKIGGVKRYE